MILMNRLRFTIITMNIMRYMIMIILIIIMIMIMIIVLPCLLTDNNVKMEKGKTAKKAGENTTTRNTQNDDKTGGGRATSTLPCAYLSQFLRCRIYIYIYIYTHIYTYIYIYTAKSSQPPRSGGFDVLEQGARMEI